MNDPALKQLRDIHLPPAIHFWPIAPGFLFLYLITTALIIYGLYYWHQKRKRLRPINYALCELNRLQGFITHNPDNINIAQELSILLRRTALYYFKRENIAGLSRDEWLNFLNTSSGIDEFSTKIGHLLIDAPYRKQVNSAELEPLFALSRIWLKRVGCNKRKRKNVYI